MLTEQNLLRTNVHEIGKVTIVDLQSLKDPKSIDLPTVNTCKLLHGAYTY